MNPNNLCIICLGDKPVTDDNPMTDEHIIPEFIGGGLIQKNVCKDCNSKMGGNFEGTVENSPFYTIPAFAHDIRGKKKAVSNPFSGVYEYANGKFRIEKNGDITAIPNIEITSIESGLNISLNVDAGDLNSAKERIKKQLKRYFRDQGTPKSPEEITVIVENTLIETSRVNNKVESPMVKYQMSLDLQAQAMLIGKIAYELGVYHFGDSYIKDPVANKLRLMLLTLSEDESLNGQVPVSISEWETLFNDESHWVVFAYSACYVKLFGIASIIDYAEQHSQFNNDCIFLPIVNTEFCEA
jgi:hypothetical protein